ncbi:hypothetical protein GCK72_013893 [Caenorhabditis remanei]|uniref:Uncharacterized protein n=2 Tax=Caenorhabditis remanei TaxID=31234 RepID=A0A6A5GQG6_CAERE|nr:hypothetical protein GCK72_013893 [Caenorhabditis remanei]KAF1757437.1 hypothetical protein GCK72_013893 [Caenorhabditis remanei]
MFLKFLILLTIPSLAFSRKIHIQVRENVTQSCPNVDSDVIDESSLKITMKMLKNENPEEEDDEKDEVTITDINGETRQIDFPGCYRVKVSFKMLRPIENPYIEAFMQLGQNVPCKSEDTIQNLRGVDSICANVTRPTQWCPESYNSQLREMLGGKTTCKFCSLCENVKENVKDNESKLSKLKKFLSNEGKEECSTTDNIHRYTFKMCTPTQDDLNKEGTDTKDKVEEYWQYLKQGIMTTVIHVMDRNPMKSGRAEQCQKMCEVYGDSSKMSNSNYKQTLTKSIEKLCAPVDTYAACLYHTVKFDVNSDL